MIGFDAERFKIDMAKKGVVVSERSKEERLEKQRLYASIEPFCPDIKRGGSDIARLIVGNGNFKNNKVI